MNAKHMNWKLEIKLNNENALISNGMECCEYVFHFCFGKQLNI